MEIMEGLGLVVGGGGASFIGAFMAIKVHITYLTRDNVRQDKRLTALEQRQVNTDRKADLAHSRIDNIVRG